MHFDGWNTIEGRHLVFAYALVFLLQGGYAAWIARGWFTTRKRARPSA